MVNKATDLKLQAVSDLHSLGWTEQNIAELLDVSKRTVAAWKKNLKIEPRFNRIDSAHAQALYEAGESDCSIARLLSVDQSSVTSWRQKRGLPTKRPRIRYSDDEKQAARKLLKQGASSNAVMSEIGCSKRTALSLRQSIPSSNLRKVGLTDKIVRQQIASNNSITTRISQAIGCKLPRDIRDDAIAEMYADLFEGRLSIDQIEARAASYRSRAYGMCGSKYGAISIDAEDENGLTLADRLADPAYEQEW